MFEKPQIFMLFAAFAIEFDNLENIKMYPIQYRLILQFITYSSTVKWNKNKQIFYTL